MLDVPAANKVLIWRGANSNRCFPQSSLIIFKNQQELDHRFEHLQAAKFADTLKTEHGYPDIETVTLDDGDEVRTFAMAMTIDNYDTFGLRELALAVP